MSRRTCLRALSAVANAARTITATRVAPRMMRPALAGAPRMLTQHSPTRGFTASGVRGDETSKELAAVVAEELKMETENFETPQEVAQGPPAPFSLQEEDNSPEVALTRKYETETVSVKFVVLEEEKRVWLDEDEFQEEEEEEEEDIEFDNEAVFFHVSITKGKSADTLIFDCLTNGSDIKVVGMELERAGGDENAVAYTGPDYKTLDPSLQDSVQTYLEARGINGELGSYIFDVQRDKESKMYLSWLTSVEKFLK